MYEQDLTSKEVPTPPAFRRVSVQISRKTSWGTPILPPSARSSLEAIDPAVEGFDDVDLDTGCGGSTLSEGEEPWDTVDNITALGLSLHADDIDEIAELKASFSLEGQGLIRDRSQQPTTERPFNKWIKTLQRKAVQRREAASADEHGFDKSLKGAEAHSRSHHKKSSSASSLGFVTAVKSASISLASFSVAPRSRRTTVHSSNGIRANERGSNPSYAGGRLSEDSSYNAGKGSVADEAVIDRSLQRRRVIEEIISTEESYVADVRFLMNVSFDGER